MKTLIMIAAITFSFANLIHNEAIASIAKNENIESTESLKAQILQMAKSYEGQGDPDQSKQKNLETLVTKLLKLNPMPPVRDRIPLLVGAWKQVWGPYDYRNDDGGVDPQIGVKEIYQVVFAGGYYYNVAPYYPDKDARREQISLLRGEYKIDSSEKNSLRARFTEYPGVDPRPSNLQLWELPALAEADTLENRISIVPTWIVKLFFGGGTLEEVYTDQDIRILYGMKAKKGSRRSIYIMSRVN